jgi:hypothetical protein
MSKEAQITAEELRQSVAADMEQLLREVARAMNEARAGAIIADSEDPVRQAMALFRQRVYERAVQLGADKAAQAVFFPQPSPATGRRVRNKGPQDVEHLTGNGIIRIRRRIYWYREEGRDERVDRWLGIADRNVSVLARELCCRVGISGVSFAKAVENLDRVGNIRIGREWLREIVEGEGRAVVAAREDGTLKPTWQTKDCRVGPGGPTRLMVGSDGVMVPVITEAEKRKRRENQARKHKGGKHRRGRANRRRQRGADQGYKEFKIATFYDESREHQYAFGTSGNHEQLGRMLRREASKVKLAEAEEKFSVSDGAKWIRHQFEVRLPMLDAMILDFYHFAEHVAQASRVCLGEGTETGLSWTAQMLEVARTEGPGAVLVKIEDTLKPIRSAGKRAALVSLREYVTARCEMLDYPTFRARGWDIGSGVTEAFCKTLTARLKGSGMRWNVRNAEAMMALAALDHSNLWNSYWNQQRRAAA